MKRSDCSVEICVTAQHRDLVDQVIAMTGLPVHYDLNVMEPNQTLFDITGRVLQGMAEVLDRSQPDVVIVQGDTTTAMAAALAAIYKRIPVAHVEAGLRSHDINSPFPEELNRKIAGNIATWHFAPTDQARANLLAEGVASAEIDGNAAMQTELAAGFPFLDASKRLILATAHRRENFDGGIQRICAAMKTLASRRDVQIVYPVHPNPNVRSVVQHELGAVRDIHLIDPQTYLPFLYLQKQSYLILTDSGGVQEEAPSLGKPLLVMRDVTERSEGVRAGTAHLVGSEPQKIIAHANRLLDDRNAYARMATRHNPYGDGRAGQRIIRELLNG
jgi:UDP-N-acetylglucosamine 2-epimerase